MRDTAGQEDRQTSQPTSYREAAEMGYTEVSKVVSTEAREIKRSRYI